MFFNIGVPNGPKDIFKMSNNRLVKTARHLAAMFSRCLKESFFCKSNQYLTKALTGHLKNISQKHFRSVFKTLLRQLTKPFLRHLKDRCFANLTYVRANHCVDNIYRHLQIVQDVFQGVQQSISVKCRVLRVDFT